ncbi:MAG: hypothetical protein ACK46Y_09615 [Fluviicola sp.]|jgi:hypothetical protein
MRKYKLDKNKKINEPTKEQMRRHKDFTSLAHRYTTLTKRPKKPLYRDPRMFMILLVIALMLLLLFLEN